MDGGHYSGWRAQASELLKGGPRVALNGSETARRERLVDVSQTSDCGSDHAVAGVCGDARGRPIDRWWTEGTSK